MFLLCIGEPMLFLLRRSNRSVLRLMGPQCASSQSDQRQNQETHPGPTRSIPTVANGLRNHLVVFKDTEFATCLPPTHPSWPHRHRHCQGSVVSGSWRGVGARVLSDTSALHFAVLSAAVFRKLLRDPGSAALSFSLAPCG